MNKSRQESHQKKKYKLKATFPNCVQSKKKKTFLFKMSWNWNVHGLYPRNEMDFLTTLEDQGLEFANLMNDHSQRTRFFTKDQIQTYEDITFYKAMNFLDKHPELEDDIKAQVDRVEKHGPLDNYTFANEVLLFAEKIEPYLSREIDKVYYDIALDFLKNYPDVLQRLTPADFR